MLAAPAEVVPYLSRQMKPVSSANEKQFARLVADLDSDEFAIREKAAADLEKSGEAALPALRRALAGKPPPELRRRVLALLEKLAPEGKEPSAETLRGLRALEVLESAGTAESKRLLEALAGGVAEARLTEEARASLERLNRKR